VDKSNQNKTITEPTKIIERAPYIKYSLHKPI